MELGQPVDRFGEPARVGVRCLVPGHVIFGGAEAIVRREVDDLAVPGAQERDETLGLEVGKRQEDDVRVSRQPFPVEFVERQVAQSAEVRVGMVEPFARASLGRHAADGDARVREQ